MKTKALGVATAFGIALLALAGCVSEGGAPSSYNPVYDRGDRPNVPWVKGHRNHRDHNHH